MSQILKNSVSVWGVPISAELKREVLDERRGDYVSYEVKLLEAFDQVAGDSITIISDVDDGASCGVQLALGVPKFLVLSQNQNGTYVASSCAPELPYPAVKLYLETGKDTFIPILAYCLDERDNFIMTDSSCRVWKGSATYSGKNGSEDWLDYVKLWRNRVQEKSIGPKKPWWKF